MQTGTEFTAFTGQKNRHYRIGLLNANWHTHTHTHTLTHTHTHTHTL